MVYEDGEVERTIHINHAKPAKFTAPDLAEPVPLVEEPRPPLGYFPAGFTYNPVKPRAPPANRGVAAQPPPATPAAPAIPAVPAAPANQNAEPASPRRRSPRLNSELGHAQAIKSQLPARQPHSAPITLTVNRPEMARTCPLTINYNDSLGSKENPLSFTSLLPVDLHNGHSQYLSTLKQLRDALPKTLDPASRLPLCAERPHRRTWTTPPLPIHESSPMVFAVPRWRVPSLIYIPPVLSSTPGTACNLTRG